MTRGGGACNPAAPELSSAVTLPGPGGARELPALRQCSFASSSCGFAFHLQTRAHASSASPPVTMAVRWEALLVLVFFTWPLSISQDWLPALSAVCSWCDCAVHGVSEGLGGRCGALLAPPFLCVKGLSQVSHATSSSSVSEDAVERLT